jgi:hypothetical protein
VTYNEAIAASTCCGDARMRVAEDLSVSLEGSLQRFDGKLVNSFLPDGSFSPFSAFVIDMTVGIFFSYVDKREHLSNSPGQV